MYKKNQHYFQNFVCQWFEIRIVQTLSNILNIVEKYQKFIGTKYSISFSNEIIYHFFQNQENNMLI